MKGSFSSSSSQDLVDCKCYSIASTQHKPKYLYFHLSIISLIILFSYFHVFFVMCNTRKRMGLVLGLELELGLEFELDTRLDSNLVVSFGRILRL